MNALRPLVRDLIGQILYGLGATRLGGRGAAFLTIVTFHRVLPSDLLRDYPFPQLAVTPEELEWFLSLFRRHFRCGPLRDVMEAWSARDPLPPLAITFDDGQLDNYLHARPVLERMGLRATFYVVSDAATHGTALWHDQVSARIEWLANHRSPELRGLLEDIGLVLPSALPPNIAEQCVQTLKAVPNDVRKQWVERLSADVKNAKQRPWDGLMDWQQIRHLSQAGHEIGSHSQTHPILTQCDSATVLREVGGSKRDIEAQVGCEVVSFCYPNGDHSPTVQGAVAAAGYRAAVTTRWGLNGAEQDPFSLHRCDIQSSTARSFRGTLSPSRVGWRLSGYHPGLR